VLAPVHERCRGDREVAARAGPLRYANKSSGIGVGKGFEQQRVHHGEDRRVGADSEGERDDDERGKSGRAQERSAGVARVVPDETQEVSTAVVPGRRCRIDRGQSSPEERDDRSQYLTPVPAPSGHRAQPSRVLRQFVAKIAQQVRAFRGGSRKARDPFGDARRADWWRCGRGHNLLQTRS
jgi:hypothetical protein